MHNANSKLHLRYHRSLDLMFQNISLKLAPAYSEAVMMNASHKTELKHFQSNTEYLQKHNWVNTK